MFSKLQIYNQTRVSCCLLGYRTNNTVILLFITYIMKIDSSDIAKNTFNPIRNIVDKLRPQTSLLKKKFISLSLGDPTVFGNLRTADEVKRALIKAIEKGEADGYAASIGMEKAREAIAKRYKERFQVNYNSQVIITFKNH